MMTTQVTKKGVSIKSVDNGKPHRKAYPNTEQGRDVLKKNHPDIADEIIKKWDDLGGVLTIEQIKGSE